MFEITTNFKKWMAKSLNMSLFRSKQPSTDEICLNACSEFQGGGGYGGGGDDSDNYTEEEVYRRPSSEHTRLVPGKSASQT